MHPPFETQCRRAYALTPLLRTKRFFMSDRGGAAALKAGWGIVVGNLLAIILKFTFSGLILFLVIRELF